ncbi:DUF805 domain-containing protein [Pseudomonas viridiflava]|uniref:DUF805 domain-containing protein n=1 Tax=Pseudomonas viridiflava TaxID=33069 RepID=UPI000F011E84|nr:DUF805 domain-containing protein [Pseudomonas viridiflava]
MAFCHDCAKELTEKGDSCPHCNASRDIIWTPGAVSSSAPESTFWYFEVLRKYAVFEGRARREEFWMFFLINLLISIVLGFLDGFLGTDQLISTLYSIAVFLPGLAVGIRRLHDTDRSGWWMLVPIVPLIFSCQEGQRDGNRFGPSPK